MPLTLPPTLLGLHYEVARLQRLWTVELMTFDQFSRRTPQDDNYDYAQHDELRRRTRIAGERYRQALQNYFTVMDAEVVMSEPTLNNG